VRAIRPVADLVVAMREAGLLGAAAGENVIRLLPPLNVTESELDEAIERLDRALAKLAPAPAGAAE
jgi:acetylornithine/N-succinyldiaminopimelate aminotransferase